MSRLNDHLVFRNRILGKIHLVCMGDAHVLHDPPVDQVSLLGVASGILRDGKYIRFGSLRNRISGLISITKVILRHIYGLIKDRV